MLEQQLIDYIKNNDIKIIFILFAEPVIRLCDPGQLFFRGSFFLYYRKDFGIKKAQPFFLKCGENFFFVLKIKIDGPDSQLSLACDPADGDAVDA